MEPGGATSRAQSVLDLVLAAVQRGSRSFEGNLVPDLVDSWVEADDVFCLVYRQPLTGSTILGLRRTVESDWTIEAVADEVVVCELGEPLGSLAGTLQADDSGVMWWTGNPPEWKTRR